MRSHLQPGMMLSLLCFGGLCHAEASQLKAGLWDIQIEHQIIDGKDATQQIAAAQASMVQMQHSMAQMPEAMRQRMQAMMKSMNNGSMHVCISPAMASKNAPFVQQNKSHCTTSNIQRNGSTVTYNVQCKGEQQMEGHGTWTQQGNTIDSHLIVDTVAASGQHHMDMLSHMRFLGSDCQGLTPLDALASPR